MQELADKLKEHFSARYTEVRGLDKNGQPTIYGEIAFGRHSFSSTREGLRAAMNEATAGLVINRLPKGNANELSEGSLFVDLSAVGRQEAVTPESILEKVASVLGQARFQPAAIAAEQAASKALQRNLEGHFGPRYSEVLGLDKNGLPATYGKIAFGEHISPATLSGFQSAMSGAAMDLVIALLPQERVNELSDGNLFVDFSAIGRQIERAEAHNARAATLKPTIGRAISHMEKMEVPTPESILGKAASVLEQERFQPAAIAAENAARETAQRNLRAAAEQHLPKRAHARMTHHYREREGQPHVALVCTNDESAAQTMKLLKSWGIDSSDGTLIERNGRVTPLLDEGGLARIYNGGDQFRDVTGKKWKTGYGKHNTVVFVDNGNPEIVQRIVDDASRAALLSAMGRSPQKALTSAGETIPQNRPVTGRQQTQI